MKVTWEGRALAMKGELGMALAPEVDSVSCTVKIGDSAAGCA